MREIKFRGRDDYGDWHYGDVWNVYKDDYAIRSRTTGKHCPIMSETVGQYTGIKDDNGTEIYEGDIIEVFDDDGNMDCYSLGAGEVKFCRGEWCICDGSNNSLYDICDVHIVEVIGNIHDNPELMEEEQKSEEVEKA